MQQRIKDSFEVKTQAGLRLDAALAQALDVSRVQASEWIKAGYVRLTQPGGQKLCPAKSFKLAQGDLVEIDAPAPRDLSSIRPHTVAGFSILFEDKDLVVIEKPAGLAAHPSPGWHGPTVLSALLAEGVSISTSGASERQGIVHRLDVGTSGLMVVAKTEEAYTKLKRAFKERQVKKIYHALVQGLPDPLKGTIAAPIARHPGYEWKFAVVEGGRQAITDYRVLEAFGPASLLEIRLHTGRTHQIRVHFSALKHPCAGDLTYGADPAISANLGLTRQWLHARQLGFEHPASGDYLEFMSDYPQDLQFALDYLAAGQTSLN